MTGQLFVFSVIFWLVKLTVIHWSLLCVVWHCAIGAIKLWTIMAPHHQMCSDTRFFSSLFTCRCFWRSASNGHSAAWLYMGMTFCFLCDSMIFRVIIYPSADDFLFYNSSLSFWIGKCRLWSEGPSSTNLLLLQWNLGNVYRIIIRRKSYLSFSK